MATKNEILDLRKKILDDEYSHLNKEQREAVFSNDGPLLILAGAGSGKTTAVISKIGYLIRYGNTYNSTQSDATDDDKAYLEECLKDKTKRTEQRYLKLMASDPINAYNLLAITFTNKAAGEMRERLEKQYNISGDKLWALTFHSLCVRILRRFADRIGFQSNFTIYDDTDSHKLIDSIIKKHHLSENYNAKVVSRIISAAKCKYVSAGEYVHEGRDLQQVPMIYKEYQAELKNANAFDFDDLIFMTVRLLSSNEEVRKTINNRFQYVLVDEYQDTNPLQYRLVSLLAPTGKICVVGDDDQSIYRFMGASIENILSFERQFTDAKVVRLEQNYRSTQTILDAANAVIANNEGRKGKRLWTDQGPGHNITVNQLNTQSEEGEYICRSIMSGKGTHGFKNNDFCILYRTNAQSNSIEHSLRMNGIPYRVFGGQPFFKRKEIQDVLAYLNVICNPYDRTRLLRIINEPKRGIGDTTLDKISGICESTGAHFFDVIANAAAYPELQRSSEKLMDFARTIKMLSDKSKVVTPSQLFTELLATVRFEQALRSQYDLTEAISRIENVHELQNNILEYEKNAEEPTLLGYLEQTALVSAVDNLDENEPAVTLMTMHCAKGLEFDVVFLIGFEEGLFPSAMSVNEPGGLEEERRLCYVAITRARKQLFITSVRSRMLYGTPRPAIPSRFLKEIPPELITEVHHIQQEIQPPVRRSKPMHERALLTNAVTVIPKSKDTKTSYRAGQKVKHKVFGEGVLVSVTEMSSDSLLEVDFATAGKKKLMANFAKLMIIE
ncbi:MAG: UvrD-helicase domain-containing protein [Clostridia bacterium]|nr:UvrD-helicase domain-containing protein [Clostridia bacterium]